MPPNRKGRGGPRRSRPSDRVPARIAVAAIVADAGDNVPACAPTAPCAACGHDAAATFRQRLSACEDAWRAGQRVGREAVRDTEITAYWLGWEHGRQAGLDEGRATA